MSAGFSQNQRNTGGHRPPLQSISPRPASFATPARGGENVCSTKQNSVSAINSEAGLFCTPFPWYRPCTTRTYGIHGRAINEASPFNCRFHADTQSRRLCATVHLLFSSDRDRTRLRNHDLPEQRHGNGRGQSDDHIYKIRRYALQI